MESLLLSTRPARCGSEANSRAATGEVRTVAICGILELHGRFAPSIDCAAWAAGNTGNGYIDDIHGWDFDGNNNSTFDGTQDDHGFSQGLLDAINRGPGFSNYGVTTVDLGAPGSAIYSTLPGKGERRPTARTVAPRWPRPTGSDPASGGNCSP